MKIITILILLTSLQSYAAKYDIDKAHSNVAFKIKHMGFNWVNGNFKDYTGSFEYDAKTGALSAVDAKIDLSSVNTNEPDRDTHLKSDDFFGVVGKDKKVNEAKRYMTYKSKKVDTVKGKPSVVHGDLTLNGKTLPVDLKIVDGGVERKDPYGNTKVGFEATATINRQKFGVSYNKPMAGTADMLIGDDVQITIDGEAKKQ